MTHGIVKIGRNWLLATGAWRSWRRLVSLAISLPSVASLSVESS